MYLLKFISNIFFIASPNQYWDAVVSISGNISFHQTLAHVAMTTNYWLLVETARNGIKEEIPGLTLWINRMKIEKETEKNVYNESQDDEEIEAIPIEDITKLKEAS